MYLSSEYTKVSKLDGFAEELSIPELENKDLSF